MNMKVVASLVGLVGLLGSTVFLVSLFVPPWLPAAMLIYRTLEGIAICLFFCCALSLPVLFSTRARRFLGPLYLWASFPFGAVLAAESCLYITVNWGRGWLLTGILLGGVGVVPIAALATLTERDWAMLGSLFVEICVIIGARLLSFWALRQPEKTASILSTEDWE